MAFSHVARPGGGIYEFATTDRVKRCDGMTATAAAIPTLVACLRENHPLLWTELEWNDSTYVESSEAERLPVAMRSLLGKTRIGESFLLATINGDGVTFEIVLVMTPNGPSPSKVRKLLVDTHVEGG